MKYFLPELSPVIALSLHTGCRPSDVNRPRGGRGPWLWAHGPHGSRVSVGGTWGCVLCPRSAPPCPSPRPLAPFPLSGASICPVMMQPDFSKHCRCRELFSAACLPCLQLAGRQGTGCPSSTFVSDKGAARSQASGPELRSQEEGGPGASRVWAVAHSLSTESPVGRLAGVAEGQARPGGSWIRLGSRPRRPPLQDLTCHTRSWTLCLPHIWGRIKQARRAGLPPSRPSTGSTPGVGITVRLV